MPDKHAKLSPSSAHRWLHCTASPNFEAQFPDSASCYAAEGTLAHHVCELTAKLRFKEIRPAAFNTQLNKLKANPLFDAEMLETANIYSEHLWERFNEAGSAQYIAFEVPVDISSYVPEEFGTCDCILISKDKLIITDYKHVKGVPVEAKDNPQMMLYALGAIEKYRSIYGMGIQTVAMYIDQPRLNSYGGYDMPIADLLEWGESIKPITQRAWEGNGEYCAGDWCRFCRGRAQCKARAEKFSAFADFAEVANDPNKLSNKEIGELLEKAAGLVSWYSDLEAYALSSCLDGEEIPGWKAVEGPSRRTWSDQEAALKAIKQAGVDEAIVYDRVPKTLAQLEKALGKKTFADIAGAYVFKPPGKPTLVPETDKRPAYHRAEADFKNIENGGN